MEMVRYFTRFYTYRIKLYKLSVSGAYVTVERRNDICELRCDLQPLSADLAHKEYSAVVDKAYKLYCEPCDKLTEGLYADIDGYRYVVRSVSAWETGAEAVLERVSEIEH